MLTTFSYDIHSMNIIQLDNVETLIKTHENLHDENFEYNNKKQVKRI